MRADPVKNITEVCKRINAASKDGALDSSVKLSSGRILLIRALSLALIKAYFDNERAIDFRFSIDDL